MSIFRNWALLARLERAILERIAFTLRIALGICGALVLGVQSHQIELPQKALWYAGLAFLIIPGVLNEIGAQISRKADKEVDRAYKTPSPDQRQDTKICPQCHDTQLADATFCNQCGYHFTSAGAQTIALANAETQPQGRVRVPVPPEVQ